MSRRQQCALTTTFDHTFRVALLPNVITNFQLQPPYSLRMSNIAPPYSRDLALNAAVMATQNRIARLEHELASAKDQLAYLMQVPPLETPPLSPALHESPIALYELEAGSFGLSKRKRAADDAEGSGKAPKVIDYPKGNIAPLRKPTNLNAWYGRMVGSDEKWAKLKPARQRQASHIGYIEETEAGMMAPEPCLACSSSLWPRPDGTLEKHDCKIYRPETASKYTKALGNNWRSCSSCWGREKGCEFTRDPETRLKWDSHRYHLEYMAEQQGK